jgi:pSer/pThr/pTyr-binding forkhead associated (FHA) protein
MGAALRFKHVNVPRQQGEQARLKVVQGPDYGAVYVITGTRTTLGRGEENDIMVSDLKASRRHAEFLANPGGWSVKDLGSANGLLHNGKVTREASIKSGDTLTFGETTLEFLAAESATMMLVAPPRSASELQAERAALEQQKKRARSFGVVQGGAGAPEGPKSRRVVLYAAAAVAAFLLLMGSPEQKPTAGKGQKKPLSADELSKYLPGGNPDPTTSHAAEQFFKAGFREYLSGNFLRARVQFETVLQMSPGHPLATLYLENCMNAINDEVKFHLDQGRKGIEAGKLKEARAHYEAVLRILNTDRSNPSYVEGESQLKEVNKLLSGGGK